MNATPTLTTFDVPARSMTVALPIDPPDGGWTFPPTSVTLISGERDAVLVDALFTVRDATDLADWIEAGGKRLTHIVITHAHFDHYLGTSALVTRFPQVKVVATAETVALIAAEKQSGSDIAAWSAMLVDDLVTDVVVPEVLPTDGRIDLEGHDVLVIAAGQSDLSHCSYVWVPVLSAAVVGDIAYNDVHLPFLDSTPQTRAGWLATLRDLQRRRPRIVVASHRRADAVDDAAVLVRTAEYLQLGDALLRADPPPSLDQFVGRLVEAHPSRANVSTATFSGAGLGLR